MDANKPLSFYINPKLINQYVGKEDFDVVMAS